MGGAVLAGEVIAGRRPLQPGEADAIRRGMIGRIAVTYMEWAGSSDQKVIVPWSVPPWPVPSPARA